MGEGKEEILSQPLFLEVSCRSSGKVRRFAAGTEAGFALYLINKKLPVGALPALHIEAFKEGEEPVSFGPNAILVNYGKDWKLQTVTENGFEEAKRQQISRRFPNRVNISGVQSPNRPAQTSNSFSSFWYLGKITFAFALICLLGGILALFLENLPALILFVNNSLSSAGWWHYPSGCVIASTVLYPYSPINGEYQSIRTSVLKEEIDVFKAIFSSSPS